MWPPTSGAVKSGNSPCQLTWGHFTRNKSSKHATATVLQFLGIVYPILAKAVRVSAVRHVLWVIFNGSRPVWGSLILKRASRALQTKNQYLTWPSEVIFVPCITCVTAWRRLLDVSSEQISFIRTTSNNRSTSWSITVLRVTRIWHNRETGYGSLVQTTPLTLVQ